MASSGRSHDRHYMKDNSEVNSARNKLDGVLQTLMDKTDDSPVSSDEDVTKHIPDMILKEATPLSPKKLPGSKTPRKRRRKDDGVRDAGQNHYSYVTKLFDRSVDLAQFTEDTPLYPVCRAWMHNEPYNVSLRQSKNLPSTSEQEAFKKQSSDVKDDFKEDVVDKLPVPLPMPKGEGCLLDLRIPSPLSPDPEKLDINADTDKAPSRETLLSNHMVRWKNIRQRWKRASFTNETRYKESLTIIKAMKVVLE